MVRVLTKSHRRGVNPNRLVVRWGISCPLRHFGSVTIYAVTSTVSNETTHDLGADPNQLMAITITASSTPSNTQFALLQTAQAGQRLVGASRPRRDSRRGTLASTQGDDTAPLRCRSSKTSAAEQQLTTDASAASLSEPTSQNDDDDACCTPKTRAWRGTGAMPDSLA